MRPIKVLLVAPIPKELGGSYTTGVCKVAYELMRHTPEGVTYYLSSSNISESNAKALCAYENQYKGYRLLLLDLISDILLHPIRTLREMYTYHKAYHVNPIRYEFLKVNIKKQISEIRPDLIHVHTTEVPAVYFANECHIPVVNTFHGIFYRGEPEQENHGDFLKNCAKHCDYFTGLTKECEYYMKTLLTIPDDKMTIIPNGIDTKTYYYDEQQRAQIRKQFCLSDSTTLFITVASIQERKGQLRFIKLLERLDIDWQYWLIGSGPDLQLVENYIKENKLTSRVTCLGRIDSTELYKYYSAADIYAHPSTMEGQALCEMEAYATGIRTIVNKEIKDTVTTGVDNRDIYYVVDMVYTDYDDLKDWISKGNSNRISRCDTDWNIISSMYRNYYKRLLINSNR